MEPASVDDILFHWHIVMVYTELDLGMYTAVWILEVALEICCCCNKKPKRVMLQEMLAEGDEMLSN